jgi:DNA-binding XRE family transcriptional regulator
MRRLASIASHRFSNGRVSSARYPVTINPLLRDDPIPNGYRDLDEVLSELIDDDARSRISRKRQELSSAFDKIGRGLRTLRMQRGLSQSELAIAVGTSQPRLSVWENDPETMSIDSARALARVLQTDYNTFFKVVFGE